MTILQQTFKLRFEKTGISYLLVTYRTEFFKCLYIQSGGSNREILHHNVWMRLPWVPVEIKECKITLCIRSWFFNVSYIFSPRVIKEPWNYTTDHSRTTFPLVTQLICPYKVSWNRHTNKNLPPTTLADILIQVIKRLKFKSEISHWKQNGFGRSPKSGLLFHDFQTSWLREKIDCLGDEIQGTGPGDKQNSCDFSNTDVEWKMLILLIPNAGAVVHLLETLYVFKAVF